MSHKNYKKDKKNNRNLCQKQSRLYLSIVPPLMEGRCSLVVLQTLENGTVDDHFMILNLSSHNAECLIDSVMVNVHLDEYNGSMYE